MAWIESWQSLATHRKTYALATTLNIPRTQAVGILHFLWYWALDNAPDGDLSGIDPKVINDVCLWYQPSGGDILLALKATGWIDSDPDTLHDWDEYAGKIEYHRLKNKEYQQNFRAKQRELLQPENRKSYVNLTSTLRKGATQPNPTQPNSTVPTKEIDKERASSSDSLRDIFYSFKDNTRYKDINFDNEFAKFTEYWLEGKRKLKNTKLACHNWLDRCLERNGGNLSKPGGRDSSNPDKFYGGKLGHMVQR